MILMISVHGRTRQAVGSTLSSNALVFPHMSL